MSAKELRNKLIVFKVTDKEEQKFEAARKELGMDKSNYARYKLFYEGEAEKK